ncbi:hypothetical protein DCE79_13665 [Lysinibacillus sp. 2017]|uniref:TlpA family protein disulfide reductase n=1 Tax=unclassified Lysinibacillus TaxID=2636778 RepID=UPI000D528A42|nr:MULTISPECIES: hypothetical protein [unclassified Lysinibacillus]AWE08385.1 hypothetical protein DCE79_13665 [Lysinibacillus sp. 2017]TGN35767.1 hypothetical protein E4L99_07890 [Lysinibacillus sp. S2017]
MINLIYLLTVNLMLLVLSIMMLYLYKLLIDSSTNKRLPKNEDGLKKGEVYPLTQLKTIGGSPFTKPKIKVGSVIIITSYGCEVCKRVYPYLEDLRKEFGNLQFNILMLATEEQARENIHLYNLEKFQLALIKHEQLHNLGITGFPFAYLLSRDDKVLEKGLVNHKKDFELLISYLRFNKSS